MRYRLQRHDGTDCSATMVPITVLRMVPIQRYRQKQEARLKNVYEQTMKNQQVKMEKSEYAQDEPIAAEAKRIINEIALTGWTSGGHSAGYVPVFAIGAGAEKFQNRIDNTEIPVKIAEAAGYSRK